MPRAETLPDRALLSVAGPAARDFLQGLVTNDLSAPAPGTARYAALLTPQGKILHEFLAVKSGEGFLIDCAALGLADLTRRLALYRLRAKVEIAPRPDLAVAALWDGALSGFPEGMVRFDDPRLPALGARLLGPAPMLEAALAPIAAGDYHAHALALGVPSSADLPPDSIFALDAGLEELHGVDFRKGCYVGQEVTARMKHRATARKRPMIAEFEGAPPPPGTKLEAGGLEIGVLATGAGARAIGHVRLDRLAEAQSTGIAVMAAGRTVILRKPDWIAP